MTIFVYFIGGSLDLSKRALPDERPPMRLYAARLPDVNLISHEGEPPKEEKIVCVKETYAFLGSCSNPRQKTYVYEYVGDR